MHLILASLPGPADNTPVLRALEYGVIVLLWLFFIWVVRAVWVEVRPLAPPGRGADVGRSATTSAGGGRLRLNVIGPEDGRPHFDVGEEVTVGRAAGCGVPVDYDTYTSNLHARLFRLDGDLWVEDLGSTNGTWVNTVRIGERTSLERATCCRSAAPCSKWGSEMTLLRSGSATDTGLVRSVNQDLAVESLNLFAVADGMGGHAGGEMAARMAVDALTAGSPAADGRRPGRGGDRGQPGGLEHSLEDPELRGMGTTLIAAALVNEEAGRLVLANVGDSRAYRLHGGELVQLTTDHSWPRSWSHRRAVGAEAAVHPHRHILTRALGVPPTSPSTCGGSPKKGTGTCSARTGSPTRSPPSRSPSPVVGHRSPQGRRPAGAGGPDPRGNDNITAVVVDVVVGEGDSSPPPWPPWPRTSPRSPCRSGRPAGARRCRTRGRYPRSRPSPAVSAAGPSAVSVGWPGDAG